MGMVDVGVQKAAFRDIPRVSWLLAGAYPGITGRPVLRRVLFVLLLPALAVGPAYLWTDASRRMVIGVQSKEESTKQLVRGLLLATVLSLISAAVLVFGFTLMMEHFPAYGGLILLAVLGVLALLLIIFVPLQFSELAAMRALKPWKDSPTGFRYVSGLAADSSVTPQELEGFVNRVLMGRFSAGTCLGVVATAPEQLGFFQRMGFSPLGTTLALVGHVPARTASVPDHAK
ncbi:hypothetical protein [Arthrobacter celericrescens]|uniref:hypothetical protein n=1 Tax=Arthrobacter celericrescens TaxID=2320851 RepID=UPI000EA31F88|nr:hypothetical protein [Arthrobacter celericrescens]